MLVHYAGGTLSNRYKLWTVDTFVVYPVDLTTIALHSAQSANTTAGANLTFTVHDPGTRRLDFAVILQRAGGEQQWLCSFQVYTRPCPNPQTHRLICPNPQAYPHPYLDP